MSSKPMAREHFLIYPDSLEGGHTNDDSVRAPPKRTARRAKPSQALHQNGRYSVRFSLLHRPCRQLRDFKSATTPGSAADDTSVIVTADSTVKGHIANAAHTYQVEVALAEDGDVVATLTTDAGGNFTFKPTDLSPGEVHLYFRGVDASDPAQTVTGEYLEYSFVYQPLPSLIVSALSLQNDTGASPTDKKTSDATVMGTLAAIASDDSQVAFPSDFTQITVEVDQNGDGAVDGTAIVDGNHDFSYLPTGLLGGEVTIRVLREGMGSLTKALMLFKPTGPS